MATDVTTKRENLAVKTVFATRDLLSAISKLQQLADELPQCQITAGDGQNVDPTFFVNDACKHINGYDVNAMLGDVLGQFNAIINNQNTFYKNVMEKII